ncbi:SAM-dependent methyltransferase [Planctomycetales bacterium 10988]|nr:SAM-dependent methyltransferase [Planctomycetales bacterium 10988]
MQDTSAPSHELPTSFFFVTCQRGAESAVKWEMSQLRPEWHFAFSRPGFLTFKLPPGAELAENTSLPLVFARAFGVCWGKIKAPTLAEGKVALAKELKGEAFERLHVWNRDLLPAGDFRYEPRRSEEAMEVERTLLLQEDGEEPTLTIKQPDSTATLGDRVLDVILVEPDEWWYGCHRMTGAHLPWPGGLSGMPLPAHAVARTYLKMAQALEWSKLPIKEGQWCAELGSSPGGASQALLDRGLSVIGIDPAEMAPEVLNHPQFVWLQKRSTQVRKRDLRKIRWLMADMNVAPSYTLDAVEGILESSQVRLRGILITIKLPDWKLIEEVPGYLERVRSWGFPKVSAKQLQFNRQEFTVTAFRNPGPPAQSRYQRKRRSKRGRRTA